jgi:hypothetical protein
MQQSQADQPHIRSDIKVSQPRHRDLAARLAAATERQLRRQQYQQKQGLPAPNHHVDQAGARSAKVSADITSVCEELRLPNSVAAALASAAAKGHISCNPGVLLPQVRLRHMDNGACPQAFMLCSGLGRIYSRCRQAVCFTLHIPPTCMGAHCLWLHPSYLMPCTDHCKAIPTTSHTCRPLYCDTASTCRLALMLVASTVCCAWPQNVFLCCPAAPAHPAP